MSIKIERIELFNFKSYAGHVVVAPFKDFTCIVGPNGSGKSNLMDALTFVLSADNNTSVMRSKTSTNLINRNNKDTTECAVTIILSHPFSLSSNNDHNNMTDDENRAIHQENSAEKRMMTSLTRKVKNDGSIDVLVNNSPVSESEFARILQKLNISRQISTFIVFQHAVEKVAQMRSRELTGLLEHVSGSDELEQEYNTLKSDMIIADEALAHASLEKRGATQAVNQMRLAQKELERYAELRERCTEAKRHAALTELLYIETELTHQKNELAKFQRKLHELQHNIESEQNVTGLKQEYAHKHKSYVEELRTNRKLADQLRSLYSSSDRVKAALAHLRRKHEIQLTEVQTLTSADSARGREVERLRTLKRQQELLLQEYDASCQREDAQVGGTLDTLLTEEQQMKYKLLRNEADGQTVTLRQQMDTIRRQRSSMEEMIKQGKQHTERLQAQQQELDDGMQRANVHITQLHTREVELTQSMEEITSRMNKTRVDIVSLTQRATEREAELNKIQEQLHELRFVKDHDKQQSKVADAMESLRSLYAIRGRLVDVCSVPNTKYRNAVTVAMGRYLEALVVDSTNVAIECVKFLKQRRLPPITFLPLDSIHGKVVGEELRRFGGTCKPLMDVIVCDASIEPAVRFAIGQTLVCDSVLEAKQVAFGQSGVRYKVVTLDGTLLLKNGSVQGGLAAVQGRARKWDEKKYDDLRLAKERLLREAEEETGHAPSSSSSYSVVGGGGAGGVTRKQIELRELESKLNFTNNQLRVLKVEIEQSTSKLNSLRQEADKLQSLLSQAEHKTQEYQHKVNNLDEQLLQLSRQVAQVEGKVFAEFQQIVQIPNLLQLESRQMELTQQRAKKRQEFVLLIHKLNAAVEAETKRIGGVSASDGRDILAQLQQEINHHEAELQKYVTQTTELNTSYGTSKRTIATLRSELDGVERQIYQLSRNTEGELNRLAHARRGAAGLQTACETLRLKRRALIQRCQIEGVELPLRVWEESAVAQANTNTNNLSNDDNDEADEQQEQRNAVSKNNKDTVETIKASEPFVVIGSTQEQQQQQHEEQENTDKRNKLNSKSKSSSTSTITDSSNSSLMEQERKFYVDFSALTSTQRDAARSRAALEEYKERSNTLIQSLSAELAQLAPLMKMATHYANSENKLGQSASVLEAARERARAAHTAFTAVKEARVRRFMNAFDKIQSSVNHIYQELTLGTRANAIHGIAYLTLEDTDEPYSGGTTYHATPPMKRFMLMDALSGGEKTMAALALLFAIHAASPTPLFILDEVDAALDAVNVEKLANYLRHSCTHCQFIVVSLKDQLYHLADVLIGVMKDKDSQSSRVLTMDLRDYPY